MPEKHHELLSLPNDLNRATTTTEVNSVTVGGKTVEEGRIQTVPSGSRAVSSNNTINVPQPSKPVAPLTPSLNALISHIKNANMGLAGNDLDGTMNDTCPVLDSANNHTRRSSRETDSDALTATFSGDTHRDQDLIGYEYDDLDEMVIYKPQPTLIHPLVDMEKLLAESPTDNAASSAFSDLELDTQLSEISRRPRTSHDLISKSQDYSLKKHLEEPKVKLLNFQDLDLSDQFSVEDITELLPPIFERRKKARSNGDERPSLAITFTKDKGAEHGQELTSFKAFGESNTELEPWPHSTNLRSNTSSVAQQLISHRRLRMPRMNPIFWKLCALKNDSAVKHLTPEVNVSDSLLKQLTYEEIWNLEIDDDISTGTLISAYSIKLALITRKKLWNEMLLDTRNDLFGDHAPWNIPFVPETSDTVDMSGSSEVPNSIVRMHSHVKPWLNGTIMDPESANQMLRPCGTLSMGRIRSMATGAHYSEPAELQYVVKGWCDARFAREIR